MNRPALAVASLLALVALACESRSVQEVAPVDPAPTPPNAVTETAYFAGGCFWGVEDVFAQLPGVLDAQSGYQGGSVEDPSYEEVCGKKTGHAEAVKVVFDPARVSYRELLDVFFKNHDPTTLDRQGPDVGSQYRSAIFAASPQQKEQAEQWIRELTESRRFGARAITTTVEMAPPFYPAEDYHQDYHARHGGSCRVIR